MFNRDNITNQDILEKVVKRSVLFNEQERQFKIQEH